MVCAKFAHTTPGPKKRKSWWMLSRIVCKEFFIYLYFPHINNQGTHIVHTSNGKEKV